MKLQSKSSIDWVLNIEDKAVVPAQVHFGKGAQPIQIAVAEAQTPPSRALLKTLFNDRKGRLQVSVMVAVEIGQEVHLFGPDPDSEVLVQRLAVATSFLNSVLEQENGILAYQRAISVRRSLQTTDMPGFTNNGLFASHYVRTSISSHPKWDDAQKHAMELQGLRNRDLIDGLGFEVTSSPSRTLLLSAKSSPNRVVAILLESGETFDSNSPRFQSTPVEWGLGIANQQGTPWVVAIRDSQIRLYPAKDGVGVGQKSQVETFFEVDLLTIDEEKAGILSLIFSAEALSENGTAEELLKNSHKFASDLGKRLRERVYESVVPDLAKEVANQLRVKGHELDANGLQLAYELTLRILFRLLFQAYAEDRGLLPSGRNELFDSNSIKHWADHLLKRDPEAQFGESATIWFDLRQIWDAIDQGNPDMQIPAYNGGLFGSDANLHPEGHLLSALAIPDRVMGPALRALVVDDLTEDGVPGPVDFRSLSVREFGTIYEGLLESSLSIAEQDLTVDKKSAWVPAEKGDRVFAAKSEIYFHSASGERKATGSYYTPTFLVDHLIDRSITPALEEHLSRVKKLIEENDQARAYAEFFNFRVADLAMGSAHFLVAAVDKIETMMRSFLIEPGNSLDGVNAELLRLESAAKKSLGEDEAAYAQIERASLLRRQIARRCIYGLDINPLAVELSRLAIWIHTFVPGLPMSSLEHNLVCANSLTGIGTVEEGLNAFDPGRLKNGTSLFDNFVDKSLLEAKLLLENVANADEANKKEAQLAAENSRRARQAANKAKKIFDLAVANQNKVVSTGAILTEEALDEMHASAEVTEFIASLQPAHMPYLFPEIFLRDTPGFSVLIGNPPWEELVIDKTRFWASKVPGLLSLPVQKRDLAIKELELNRPADFNEFSLRSSSLEKIRKVLTSRFPLGVGDADLYKAFCWVALDLLSSQDGHLGFVLPKTAFSAAGMEGWRKSLQEQGSIAELTYLVNSGRWIFDIHPQYSVALVNYVKGKKVDLALAGPLHSKKEFFDMDTKSKVYLDHDIVLSFTDSASIPSINSQKSADILSKMRLSQSLKEFAGGKFRAVSEFHATNDRQWFDHGPGAAKLPVLSGKSFNVWSLGSGENFAWADPAIALKELDRKLDKQLKVKSSAFYGLSKDLDLGGVHPVHRPRIAFRGVTNPTNSRTFIAALIPQGNILTNIAPYILSPISSEKDEAFLLAVFSSLPFDWYARKFIETAVNFHLLSAFPIPAPAIQGLKARIVEIGGILGAYDERLEDWAKKVGITFSPPKTQSEKAALIGELDGLVALAYGLSANDLKHIFETFHRGWSDSDRLETATNTLKTWSQLK